MPAGKVRALGGVLRPRTAYGLRHRIAHSSTADATSVIADIWAMTIANVMGFIRSVLDRDKRSERVPQQRQFDGVEFVEFRDCDAVENVLRVL